MTEISAVGFNQYGDPRLAFLARGGVMEIDDIVAKLERVEAA
jgi:hypothetical protein